MNRVPPALRVRGATGPAAAVEFALPIVRRLVG